MDKGHSMSDRSGEGVSCCMQFFGAVTDVGASRVAADVADTSDRAISVINGLQYDIAVMQEALKEAERFMSYFAGETSGFYGAGMPRDCLAKIRAAIYKKGASGG